LSHACDMLNIPSFLKRWIICNIKLANTFFLEKVICQSRGTVDPTRGQSGRTQFLQFFFLGKDSLRYKRPKEKFIIFCFKIRVIN